MPTGPRTFEDERDRLDRLLARMGGAAERALADALLALTRRDADLATEVVRLDPAIDAYEDEINECVVRALALHRPVAEDLRWMVSALKIASRLERIGDQASGIAERAAGLTRMPPLMLPRVLDRMARLAQGMTKQALDSLSGLGLAVDDRDRSAELDQLHDGAAAELVALMRDDPRSAPAAAQLLLVARAIGRIGAHAAVVARLVSRPARVAVPSPG